MVKKEMIIAISTVGMIIAFKEFWKSLSGFDQTAFRGYALLGKEKFITEVKMKEPYRGKLFLSLVLYEKADPSFSVEKAFEYMLNGIYEMALPDASPSDDWKGRIHMYVDKNPPYIVPNLDLYVEVALQNTSPDEITKLKKVLESGGYKKSCKESLLFQKLVAWGYCSEADADEHIDWIVEIYKKTINKLDL